MASSELKVTKQSLRRESRASGGTQGGVAESAGGFHLGRSKPRGWLGRERRVVHSSSSGFLENPFFLPRGTDLTGLKRFSKGHIQLKQEVRGTETARKGESQVKGPTGAPQNHCACNSGPRGSRLRLPLGHRADKRTGWPPLRAGDELTRPQRCCRALLR